jgi:Uma2 family endonuclease
LRFDTTIKAGRYASMGVREYWVVDAKTLVTRIHREPTAEGYKNVAELAPDVTLTPLFLPAVSVRLADLPID